MHHNIQEVKDADAPMTSTVDTKTQVALTAATPDAISGNVQGIPLTLSSDVTV